MITSVGYGRFTAGQPDAFYAPRVFDKAKPLIIYMPGMGFTPVNGPMSAAPLITALVDAGYCVAQPNVDGLLGNATAQTRMANALTWGQANLGATTAAPIMIGASNGGVCSLQYARQNPVTAVVALIAPVDLVWIRDNNVSGLAAAVNTAAGVTGTDPLPAHFDLLPDAASYATAGPKVQAWASTNDPLDNPATGHSEHEFATAVGADFHSAGAVGHLETSWSGLDIPTAIAFLDART